MTYESLRGVDDSYIIGYMKKLEKEVEETLDTVSRNIARIRRLRGLSQLQLALEIGMKGNAFIARAERRKDGAHFNIEHIVLIAKVLDENICNFFKNETEDNGQ